MPHTTHISRPPFVSHSTLLHADKRFDSITAAAAAAKATAHVAQRNASLLQQPHAYSSVKDATAAAIAEADAFMSTPVLPSPPPDQRTWSPSTHV